MPKRSPSANLAQVQMSRGTLTCLNQTGECFLLTFDLWRHGLVKSDSIKTSKARPVLPCSWHLGSSRGLCLSVHNLELCLWRGSVSTPRHHDGILTRQNHLPKSSPSAHVAQVQMSRGTLTCLSQTGEGFLLTFDLGRQDVNNKNNHGVG